MFPSMVFIVSAATTGVHHHSGLSANVVAAAANSDVLLTCHLSIIECCVH